MKALTLFQNIWLPGRRRKSQQPIEKIASRGPSADIEEVIATAERKARQRVEVAELKARYAELERTIAELNRRIMGKAKASSLERDWLCYLPSAAGSLEVIARAESYLEAMRTRLEAEGCRMWLCHNHDCQTRIFQISEFRAMHGSVFCSGDWTATGRKYRHLYRGVSADFATFAGDIDLVTQITMPPNCMQLDDMPAAVQAAARSPQVRGLAGAACFEPMDPARGVTGIYRLAHDKQRIVGGRSPASCPLPEGTIDKNLGTL